MRPVPSGGQDQSSRDSAVAAKLTATSCALPTEAIADVIECLIAVLDARGPDPDREPDPDGEPDEDACDNGDDLGTIPFDRWAWREEVHASRRQAQQMLRSQTRRRAA